MEKKWQKLPSLPQLAKMAFLLLLFLVPPLVASSLRSLYLYLLFNALVLAVGIESGFLAAIAGLRDDKKPLSLSSCTTTTTSGKLVKPSGRHAAVATDAPLVRSDISTSIKPAMPNSSPNSKLAASDFTSNACTVTTKKKIKKCPSRASIFFIGSTTDAESVKDTIVCAEDEVEVGGGGREEARRGSDLMSRQELFMKAEAFIDNFYKQLKMQREESWKRLQDLCYHHACKVKDS